MLCICVTPFLIVASLDTVELQDCGRVESIFSNIFLELARRLIPRGGRNDASAHALTRLE